MPTADEKPEGGKIGRSQKPRCRYCLLPTTRVVAGTTCWFSCSAPCDRALKALRAGIPSASVKEQWDVDVHEERQAEMSDRV